MNANFAQKIRSVSPGCCAIDRTHSALSLAFFQQVWLLAIGLTLCHPVLADDAAGREESPPTPGVNAPLMAPLPQHDGVERDSPPTTGSTPVDVLPVLSTSEIPLKVARYAKRFVSRLDKNSDSVLQAEEWSERKSELVSVDADGNGELTWLEIASRMARYGRKRSLRPWVTQETPGPRVGEAGQSNALTETATESSEGAPRRETRFFVPSSRLSSSLPKWFVQKDDNGDGQLTLKEFAPDAAAGALRQFGELDRDGDGVLTPRELSQKPSGDEKPESAADSGQ